MRKLRRIVRNIFAPRSKVRHDRCKKEDDDKEHGGSIESQERRPARQFQILNHGAARDLAVAARAPRSLNTMLKRSLRSFTSGVIAEVRVAPENSGDWSMIRTRRAASAENPDSVTVPSAMRVSVRNVWSGRIRDSSSHAARMPVSAFIANKRAAGSMPSRPL